MVPILWNLRIFLFCFPPYYTFYTFPVGFQSSRKTFFISQKIVYQLPVAPLVLSQHSPLENYFSFHFFICCFVGEFTGCSAVDTILLLRLPSWSTTCPIALRQAKLWAGQRGDLSPLWAKQWPSSQGQGWGACTPVSCAVQGHPI